LPAHVIGKGGHEDKRKQSERNDVVIGKLTIQLKLKKSKTQIAKDYGVPFSTLSTRLKNKDAIHCKTPGNTGNKTMLFSPIIAHASVTNI